MDTSQHGRGVVQQGDRKRITYALHCVHTSRTVLGMATRSWMWWCTVAWLALARLGSTAWAGPPSIEDINREAKAALASGDRDGFEACGHVFIHAYNEYEGHPRADTLLWNAADCFDAAGMVGAATQARRALLDVHPQSSHRQDTLWLLAKSFAQVADYQDAAERFETYAAEYPADYRTPDALQNAYLYRVGLSQPELALADLDRYERLYARKDPDRAAAVFWTRQQLLDDDAARRAHAVDYLARYRSKGARDHLIVAEVTIAQSDWRRSCPEPLLHDLCVSIERHDTSPAPHRCELPQYTTVTVHKRDTKLAAQAQERLRSAAKVLQRTVEIPEHDVARIAAFRQVWVLMLLYPLDAAIEAELRVELPGKLDDLIANGPAAAAAQRRLAEFLAQRFARMHELSEGYAEIKGTGSNAHTILAAWRTATLQLSLAERLRQLPVPATLRAPKSSRAFCDAMIEQTTPLVEAAIASYEYCLDRAIELQHFDATAQACEDELHRLDPTRWPATVELFGEPGLTSPGIVRAGLIAEDPTQPPTAGDR